MKAAKGLSQDNAYSYGQKLISRLLIVMMLLLDLPFVNLMQTAKAVTINPNNWVTIPVKPDPIMQGLTIPANAATQGMWSSVQNWPINGLHTAVLPDGRVLTFGTSFDGNIQDGRYFDVWDSTLGFGTSSHNTAAKSDAVNSFCATSSYLNNGSLLVSGGNDSKSIQTFSPSTNIRSTLSTNLALDRWYATMLNLPDGRPIILGGMVPYTEGMVDNPAGAIAQGLASMTPEVLESNGWRSLLGANSRDAFGPDFLRTSMPRAWVAPNGLVFGVSSDKMWYLDPAGNGSFPYLANYKLYSDTTPVNAGTTNTAVMYTTGKILLVGGNGGWNSDGRPASNQATVFDLNNGTPTLIEQPSMINPRRFGNSVVLANAQVVVTGGTKRGNDNGANTVFAAEIWTPTASNDSIGTWSTGSNASIFRGYHSQTVLLPNGTILSTGGGAPGPVTNLNAEIYYPPYLFKSVNNVSQLATRPVIKAISGLSYNNNAQMQIDMQSTDVVSKLVLLGLSQGTHSFNPGQRRIPLSFSQDSFRLTATIPNSSLTPPGYYQVVALNAEGVPSLGAIIAIGQNQTPPAVPITPYTPPNLAGTINAPILNPGGTSSYSVPALPGVTYSWNFGDGSPSTPFSANPSVSHTYSQPGLYVVTLSAKDSSNIVTTRTFVQAVATAKTTNSPTNSSPIAFETRAGNSSRIWVVNPDNDSVSVLDALTKTLISTINVGTSPRTLAVATDGRIWVANKESATISIISPTTLAVLQTIALPRASQPHGIAFAPAGGSAYIALEATGQLLKLNPSTGAQQGIVNIGSNPRHVSISADGTKVLVSRFITPLLPGESTATINVTSSSNVGGEVVVVNPSNMTLTQTIILHHSDKGDSETQGSGIPNYLSAAAISPDGTTAWVPSKQDNIKRGTLRNGQNLDFQNTVRAISSRINMTTLTEDYAKRVDHDNSSVGAAAVYHPSGVYMFVALETSRQVAVLDAISGFELFRLNVGRAPQGLAISPDGNTLYVQEFMDRSVSIFDLTPLTLEGQLSANQTEVLFTVNVEKLPAQVVLGKQLFYDAKDSRLARDSYMSCASCHNDAGHDGRVWDLTGFGEGLRNTIALKGRAAMGHGNLHWSANFDELQDFEGQIRALAGGTGLMSDVLFNSGTVNQPLGTPKAGLSTSLDDLTAYVNSLNTFSQNPNRNGDGTLTSEANIGKTIFTNNCASCHSGRNFSNSSNTGTLTNIGTIKPTSGNRLGATLTGIDTPTLLDAWATAPYLHDGSASTLSSAVSGHTNLSLSATDLSSVLAYLNQLGSEEVVASGSGLLGQYYTNINLSGTAVLQRTEAVNFNWGIASPGAGVPVDNYSVRWSGQVEAPSTGAYQFRTNSDDGVRVWVNGQLLIDNWTPHGATLDTSATINLIAGQRYNIVVQYFDSGFDAVMQLFWIKPGDAAFVTIPATQLYNTSTPNVAPTIIINTPVNNAVFTQGATIGITATAADGDGNISKVEFYDGPTLLSTITTAPYNYSWIPNITGTHVLTAKAYDDLNAVTTSTDVNVTVNPSTIVPGTGSGLLGQYYTNINLSGTAVLQRTEAVNFNWGEASPGAGVPVDNYSVRWSGQVEAPSTGVYQFRTNSDDGVRVYVNNALVINNWTNHGATLDTTANINLTAGQKYNIVVEYYDSGYDAVIQLLWKTPIDNSFSAIPITRLYIDTSNNVAPTVSLTAPTANAIFTQGTAITISANAADSDGTVARVEFYDGTALLGTDTTAPYAFSWVTTTTTATGAHSLTARAYDNTGAITTSAARSVTVNAPANVAPTVNLTAPTANAVFTQGTAITISANAADSDGTVTQVQFFDNGTLIGTDNATPYSMSLTNATVGAHSFTAVATDNIGATTTSAAVSVTVEALPNVAPAVSLTAPTANAVFTQGTAITISANAADSDGTVTQVQFFDNGTLIGTDNATPYSMSLTNATVGAHSFTAVATDNIGATTTSAAVSVTVEALPNVAPAVSLTAPTANAVFTQGTAITISANAADSDGTVTQVQFFDNGTLIGTDNATPYSMSLTNATVGAHSFTAVATDNIGATTTSAAVSVTVEALPNVAPAVSLTAPTANAVFTQGTAITISANAADSDGTVTQVQFFDNGTLIGTDNATPYSMSLTNATVGAHSFTAVATDNIGATTTSAAVSVTVEALPNVAPAVSLTAPTANAVFTQGTAITISANAADSDGTVTQVQFFDNGTLIGTDNATPYSMSLTNATVGAHSFTAVATDNIGATTTSAAVSVTVEALPNVAPAVSLTAPTANAVFTQGTAITISANAADTDGTVARVEFYDGTTLLDTDTTAPYAFSWVTTTTTATGAHSLTARAYDNTGAITTSAARSVTVNAPANVAPTVALTAPVAGSTITRGATLAITATAADSDGTVARVEFYDGTTLLGTDTTAPYAFSWVTTTTTVTGAHSLTARAYDNTGAITTSAARSVTVNAPANVAPTVALTAPVAGSTITRGATLAITATAADSDGTVARVEFYDGTALLGTDTTAPYAFSWVTTTTTATGAHSLTARAYDNTGAITTSAARSVTVNAPANVAPTVNLTAPTANAVFTQGTAITISANAADSDGTVTQVQFFDNGTLIGTDNATPYSMSLTNATVGAHSFTAVATDNIGATTTSAAVSVTVNASSGIGAGSGLLGQYYTNINLSGTAVLQRTEAVNFNWGIASPGAGVPVDNYSVRWSGQVEAPSTGAYQFRTNSDDGVRVWVNGQLLIDNWTPHGATLDTSATINLIAGQRYNIVVQYFDSGFDAVMQLFWIKPGDAAFVTIPATQLYNTSTPNVAPTIIINTPVNNAVFTQGATIGITATAADGDGNISKVEFYDGPTLLSTITTAPYNYSWIPNITGTHVLTAKAYDDLNAVTTSTDVNVTVNPSTIVPGTGSGLLGQYYTNINLSGTAVLQRTEAVNFNWGEASPGAGVPVDNYSVRWSGQVEAPSTGVYQFRTNSDDGVRVYVNNALVINNWTNHGATLDTTANINLTAGQKYNIVVEYYDSGYDAVIQLLWKTPIDTTFSIIPATRMY